MGRNTNPKGRNTNPGEPTAEDRNGRKFPHESGMSKRQKRKLSTGASDAGYGDATAEKHNRVGGRARVALLRSSC
eukprot:6519406-Karenia_brevis.AAC.1